MAALTKEYTDLRNVKHEVKHLIRPTKEKEDTEQILQELSQVFSKNHKHAPV